MDVLSLGKGFYTGLAELLHLIKYSNRGNIVTIAIAYKFPSGYVLMVWEQPLGWPNGEDERVSCCSRRSTEAKSRQLTRSQLASQTIWKTIIESICSFSIITKTRQRNRCIAPALYSTHGWSLHSGLIQSATPRSLLRTTEQDCPISPRGRGGHEANGKTKLCPFAFKILMVVTKVVKGPWSLLRLPIHTNKNTWI